MALSPNAQRGVSVCRAPSRNKSAAALRAMVDRKPCDLIFLGRGMPLAKREGFDQLGGDGGSAPEHRACSLWGRAGRNPAVLLEGTSSLNPMGSALPAVSPLLPLLQLLSPQDRGGGGGGRFELLLAGFWPSPERQMGQGAAKGSRAPPATLLIRERTISALWVMRKKCFPRENK